MKDTNTDLNKLIESILIRPYQVEKKVSELKYLKLFAQKSKKKLFGEKKKRKKINEK